MPGDGDETQWGMDGNGESTVDKVRVPRKPQVPNLSMAVSVRVEYLRMTFKMTSSSVLCKAFNFRDIETDRDMATSTIASTFSGAPPTCDELVLC